MDYLAEHRRMLELAADSKLPERIDGSNGFSVDTFRDLYDGGLVQAISDRTLVGDAYLEPRITVAGREYLNDLQLRAAAASPAGKAKRLGSSVVKWIATIVGILIAGILLSRLG